MNKRIPLPFIVKLRNEGLSLREISKRLRLQGIFVSHTAIANHLKNIRPGVILIPKQQTLDFDYKKEMEWVMEETKLLVTKQIEKLLEAHRENDISQMIKINDDLKKSLGLLKSVRCKVFSRNFTKFTT